MARIDTLAAPLGTLESFLHRASDDLVMYFMGHIEAHDVLMFGRLSIRFRYWFNAYCHRAWDATRMIKQYVSKPQSLLALMDGKDAMIYGEAVLRYFFRVEQSQLRLDICATLPKFYDIQRALWQDGYHIISPKLPLGSGTYKVVRKVVNRHENREQSWFLSGDRSDLPESHLGFKFTYCKFNSERRRVLVHIHLIRCEAYRHVLATSITPFTCFMTADRAVAPFASSTFRDRLAFTLENRERLVSLEPGQYIELGGQQNIQLLTAFGPPFDYELYPSAEVGKRYFGDDHCWTIFMNRGDPMDSFLRWKGASFEALDWEMLHDEQGTYLKIGEPFVWSSRYYYSVMAMRQSRASDNTTSHTPQTQLHGSSP